MNLFIIAAWYYGNVRKSFKEFLKCALIAYTQWTISIVVHISIRTISVVYNLNNVESQKEGFVIQIRSSVWMCSWPWTVYCVSLYTYLRLGVSCRQIIRVTKRKLCIKSKDNCLYLMELHMKNTVLLIGKDVRRDVSVPLFTLQTTLSKCNFFKVPTTILSWMRFNRMYKTTN